MFNFEHNATVSLNPHYEIPPCGATRFRWCMQVPLPFVLPSTKCLRKEIGVESGRFVLEVHNHLDRLIRMGEHPAAYPQVLLVPKLREGENQPEKADGFRLAREHLQSVAVISEINEYRSPDAAFEKAGDKIKHCLNALTDFLLGIQKSLPYLVSWTVVPISHFDVGTVHHAVVHFCPNTQRWDPIGWGVAMNLARQLATPLYVADLSASAQVEPHLDLSNELLAESQTALFRHTRRLTVLNACLAVETLANFTYKKLREEQLAVMGKTSNDAQTQAEDERKRHRTDEKFLLHTGIAIACGRSLFSENKSLYDDFCRFKKMRHQTAHAGYLPTAEEGKSCFVCCCEVVRWLCAVARLPVKPMLPDGNVIAGFAVNSGSSYTLSAAEVDVIRRAFGIVLPSWRQYLSATFFMALARMRNAWRAHVKRVRPVAGENETGK